MNPNLMTNTAATFSPYAYANPYAMTNPLLNKQLPPKNQNNAVNIEILNPQALSGDPNAMPVYPGLTQMAPMQYTALPPYMPPAPVEAKPVPYVAPTPVPAPNLTLPPVVVAPTPAPEAAPVPVNVAPPAPPAPAPVVVTPVPAPAPAPEAAPAPKAEVAPAPVPVAAPPAPAPAPTAEKPADPAAPVAPAAPTSQENSKLAPLKSAIGLITPMPGDKQATIEDQNKSLKTLFEYINQAPTMDAQSKNEMNDVLLSNDGRAFKGLAAMASADTTTMQGPDKQKADETRVMSLLTLSNLQKYFRNEFDASVKKENYKDMPPISLAELPAIATTEQIAKTDANPEIREAALISIMGVADQNNTKDVDYLKGLLQGVSQTDKDEKLKTIANDGLKVLSQPAPAAAAPAPAPAPAPAAPAPAPAPAPEAAKPEAKK